MIRVVQLIFFIALAVVFFGISYELSLGQKNISNKVQKIESFYLKESRETHGSYNVVTTILADYRSLDTLLETIVIFIASMSVLFIRNFMLDSNRQSFREFIEEVDCIYSSVTRNSLIIIFPLIIVFGLYVFVHGHYSPGGGFQSGVILATAFIMYSYAYANKFNFGFFLDRYAIVVNHIGVLIYFTVGLFGIIFKDTFLDYYGLSTVLNLSPKGLRSIGILLVELGVTLTVMSSVYLLFRGLYCESEEERWQV